MEQKASTDEASNKSVAAPQRPHTTRTAKSTHSQPRPSNHENVTVAQAREVCFTCSRVESLQVIQ